MKTTTTLRGEYIGRRWAKLGRCDGTIDLYAKRGESWVERAGHERDAGRCRKPAVAVIDGMGYCKDHAPKGGA